MTDELELETVPLPSHHDGAIFSDHPIPNMTCDWQENGEGGGVWVCRPKPIPEEWKEEAAYYLWVKRGKPLFSERITLEDWYEGEQELERREHRRGHHHHEEEATDETADTGTTP